jgi:hypothetical protein
MFSFADHIEYYYYRVSILIQVFGLMISKPPSQPSPTGEGVCNDLFPLGGNKKGGKINPLKILICS